MSQEEIKQWLLNKRLSGNHTFFTAKEIRDHIKEGKNNLHKNLNKLYLYGFIELETTIDRDLQYGTKYRFIRELIFPRRFRISTKLLKQNKTWFHTCTYNKYTYIPTSPPKNIKVPQAIEV